MTKSRGLRGRPELERFLAKIDVADDGCWNWRGYVKPNGYGQFHRTGGRGNDELAHRVAYELLVGPIPAGLHIDHLCRNRRCVNPEHLEAVTQAENNRRSESPSAIGWRRGRCPVGHTFDVRADGKHWCRPCTNEKARERYAARRGS